ncbi:MAG: helix-turn-helix transcriptional regulator [Oscillospiraceae bacterium]|jgi:putative molybdopterin biosynthesis protein|nr:helix-turn-helix transcriptional regulator [Oscillospiraceae bacterium]
MIEETYLTPQEAADILKIKKTTVYDMIKKKTLKAVKLGKQLRILESDIRVLIGDVQVPPVQVNAVSRYAETDLSVDSLLSEPAALSGVVLCGQDTLLDLLCSYVNGNFGNTAVLRSYLGSYNGLYALYQGQVNIATAHLWDAQTDSYNLPFISRILPGENVVVYHVVGREVGIYVAKNNPKNITSIRDFVRPEVTMLNREKGSGIRVLTDSLFQKYGIDIAKINGYARAVNSHRSAAAVIARGGADCAYGSHQTVMQHPLVDFIPFKEESYDMIIPKREIENPIVQQIISVLRSAQFRLDVEALGGYNTKDMGKQLL